MRTARYADSRRVASSILAACDMRPTWRPIRRAVLIALSCGCRIWFAYLASGGSVAANRRSFQLLSGRLDVARRRYSAVVYGRQMAVRWLGDIPGDCTHSLAAAVLLVSVKIRRVTLTDTEVSTYLPWIQTWPTFQGHSFKISVSHPLPSSLISPSTWYICHVSAHFLSHVPQILFFY